MPGGVAGGPGDREKVTMGRALLARSALAAIASLFCACNEGAEGTRPHDMSTAGHEEAARAEDRAALEQGAFAEALVARAERCRPDAVHADGICWSDDIHPTDQHRAQAERHLRAAAAHRAAAQALRDAEARACAGIDELDRDLSPFAHREDIVSVTPLVESVLGVGDEAPIQRTAGATIVFRATPGMTSEWLQRVVDCHLARNAALGHDVPEMPYCPLVPRGVTARVRSTGDGFAVDVRADDEGAAEEVLRRAQALLREPFVSARAAPAD